MKYDLTGMAQRASNIRRRSIVIRDIAPPAVLASDLYAAAYRPVIALIERYAGFANAEYERTLSAMITDSADDLGNIFERMGQELAALVLSLRPAMRDWTIRVERQNRSKWRGAVLAATKVDLETLIGPQDVEQTLGEILSWNVALVRDVGDQARSRMSNAVFAGLRERSPARDVAKQIREATGFARDRSLRIASDQLTKLTSSLASERRRQAGIAKWKWRSSHKLHYRPEHAARDGKVYDDTTAPKDLPGQLPFCGCREQAVIEFD